MSTKRTYILGDEWLYYKIYCGARTSDVILTETIKPLTAQLLEQGLIDSWFFIRYGDPDFHIRIRFRLPDIRAIGTVILQINAAMQHYVEQRVVYKLQTDTYIRELERYGTNTIDASETLFFYDSAMLLDAIALIEDEELYFLFVVKAIDRLLNSFGYEQQQKLELVTRNSLGFKREFHADKGLNKQLDKKYRGLKSKLSSFLETTSMQEDYKILDDLLDHKAKQSLEIVQKIMEAQQNKQLEMPLDDLLSSYIHMLVNRAFRSKQRFYELVCYDFLVRYQKTKVSYTVS
ncbi:thiopeptide-type bacteriocin biosynthesis protein [Aquimarina sp. EL_43]|uniref:thiopeptide-type bacteriocin biosynthesis protein n=1 Tax=unclassified Aquimarina TaxID=2627091 RepID=UPI0018CA9B85|nr:MULTISPECIES: thiopeptide-type bacteriocin biosynthesis protein [unclassified Aquimarina]MBG6131984.1 thiopeptide-type bacteriocin biosynthesis protein [Aquimarina sp. EL_35]MBG6149548.1 thiopeptide-type bacteriocin biosynthesis protein [Aquimarina sp. EL_32]MBG6170189.1 thiopeptide-type bacteriocin biosynthesis protein [Aquimarina sp. EL_43]